MEWLFFISRQCVVQNLVTLGQRFKSQLMVYQDSFRPITLLLMVGFGWILVCLFPISRQCASWNNYDLAVEVKVKTSFFVKVEGAQQMGHAYFTNTSFLHAT